MLNLLRSKPTKHDNACRAKLRPELSDYEEFREPKRREPQGTGPGREKQARKCQEPAWLGRQRQEGRAGCREGPISVCASVLSRLCAAMWPRGKFHSGAQMSPLDSWSVNTDTQAGKMVGHVPENVLGMELDSKASGLIWPGEPDIHRHDCRIITTPCRDVDLGRLPKRGLLDALV